MVGIRNLATSVLARHLVGLTFATLGLWIMRIGLSWSAWDITRSAFWSGAISSATLLPSLFLTPIFGVMADRIPLRRAMPIIFGIFILISAALTGLLLTNLLTRTSLLFASLAFGVTAAIYHPFRITVFARIACETPLPRIITLSSIVFNTSGILGPALAGAILSVSGKTAVFAITGGLYIGYVLIFKTLKFRARETPHERNGYLHDFKAGVRLALTLPELILASLMVLLVGFVGRSVILLLPVLTGQVLDGGADSYAKLVAVSGIGAVIAGIVLSRMATDAPAIRRNLYVASFAAMIISASFGLWNSFPAFLMASAILGFLLNIVGASSQSLVQIAVPEAFRGRVMSFWVTANFGGAAFGVVALGAAADLVGFGTILIVAGCAGALAVCTTIVALGGRSRVG